MDEQQYRMYDFILHGKVKAIQEREKTRVIEIIIVRLFKGLAQREIVITTEKIEERCGIRPAVGEEWLFFAYQGSYGPQADACTRSRNIHSGSRAVRKLVRADLRYLKGRAGKT